MATTLSNPFPLVGYHGPAYFCDRVSETEIIESSVRSGVNITLVSLRRMGKTNLLSHVAARRSAKRLPTVTVDLQSTYDMRGLSEKLATSAARSLSGSGRRFLDSMRDIATRVGASLTIDDNGSPTLTFGMRDRRSTAGHDLERVMMMIEEHRVPVLVILDEFQEVSNVPDDHAEGSLRSFIQGMARTRFVFSGSRKTMIENMFADHRRPFYASTRHMELGPLPEDAYAEYVRTWFATKRRSVQDRAVELIRDVCEGRTFHMQQVANRLWEDPTRTIDAHTCQRVVDGIVAEQAHLFVGFRALLTSTQWSVLTAIARARRLAAPLSEEARTAFGLPAPSSVRRALDTLVEREMVYHHADGYGVEDPFFALWLRTMFDRR